MGYGDKPFGLRDIKLTNIAGSTQVDLPASRNMGFKERVISGEMRGDDALLSAVTISEALEWSLEAGGISLEAWALITGRSVTTAGTSPDETKTLNARTAQDFPWFKIYGKSVSDDAVSDVHVKIYKAKITSPLEGTFQDGEFFVTSCSGIAVDDNVSGVYDVVQNETATALPAT
jgi:hypothetical protein